VLLALAGTGAAEENKPLDPAVVLGLVQSFYDQTKTLQAEFEQTRYTQLYDRYDRATGKVVFKKPGMMRWDYAQPNGQVFVSNGKKLLIYQPPEEGEKRRQSRKRLRSPAPRARQREVRRWLRPAAHPAKAYTQLRATGVLRAHADPWR
jgi:outer membrane lipoprotein-sorting protein